MVASTVWNEDIHTVNSPTENRKVINAVGLLYDSEKGNAKEIIIKTDKNSTFIGQPVKVEATAIDENKRPVDEKITFSSSDGSFKGNEFTPDVGGKVTIKAKCGSISESITIYSMDEISGIIFLIFIGAPQQVSKNLCHCTICRL